VKRSIFCEPSRPTWPTTYLSVSFKHCFLFRSVQIKKNEAQGKIFLWSFLFLSRLVWHGYLVSSCCYQLMTITIW